MGHKWDSIGIWLRQRDLVSELRLNELGSQKVHMVIDAWFQSEHEDVPVCAETISRVLRSPAVNLGAVAKEFEKVRWLQCMC